MRSDDDDDDDISLYEMLALSMDSTTVLQLLVLRLPDPLTKLVTGPTSYSASRSSTLDLLDANSWNKFWA